MSLINVLVNGQAGQMEESDLLKLEGGFENAIERTTWIQYHLPQTGELVHRSANVTLKPLCAAAIVGKF